MAYAYGSWITSSSAGWRTYLEVTESSNTATSVTYKCVLKIYSNYGLSVSGGSAYIYAGSKSGGNQHGKWEQSSYKFSFAYGGSDSPKTVNSGWTVTINKEATAKTAYFTGSAYCPDVKAGRSTASVTMTVPALATYAITYNANGGEGAPATQSKTHGTAITLSSTKPTRANYNFKGWATSASATTATYQPGASYSSNAALALYAVWEVAYSPPTVENMQVSRCNQNKALNDYGTYALITFDFSCDQNLGNNTISSAKVTWGSNSSKSFTTLNGKKNGSASFDVGTFSVETSHTATVLLTDSKGGTTEVTVTIPSAAFIMDFLSGGKGIAFGKPASAEGFACAFNATFEGSLTVGGVALTGQNKVLWGLGANQMTGSVTLNEAVSKQPNGIVLVWSAASGTTASNANFQFHFVPKHFATLGYSMNCPMFTNRFGSMASKNVTISDTMISGHSDNSYTWDGTEYDVTNNAFALRYVIGV